MLAGAWPLLQPLTAAATVRPSPGSTITASLTGRKLDIHALTPSSSVSTVSSAASSRGRLLPRGGHRAPTGPSPGPALMKLKSKISKLTRTAAAPRLSTAAPLDGPASCWGSYQKESVARLFQTLILCSVWQMAPDEEVGGHRLWQVRVARCACWACCAPHLSTHPLLSCHNPSPAVLPSPLTNIRLICRLLPPESAPESADSDVTGLL